MTAEIAILNKSAIALAADSAVTIGSGANAKIYNTISKIFELSDACPVGIMIFNRLDYMGLPLEVVIKEYRRKRSGRSFPTVAAWKDDFVSFLTTEIPVSDKDKEQNAIRLIHQAIQGVDDDFQAALNAHLAKGNRFLKSQMNGILQKTVNAEIRRLTALDFAKGFTTKKLSADYVAIVDAIANQTIQFIDLNQTSLNKLREMVGYFIAKSETSSVHTGIVVAGFGDDDICPSLAHFEMDGIIAGKLKIVERPYVDIGRAGPEAEILAFAQDDMMQSFVNGVDPQFRSYVSSLIGDVIEESARSVLAPLVPASTLDGMINAAQPVFHRMTETHRDKIDSFIEQRFTQRVKAMVRAMPKPDLATLAESLIEITSLKRKVTRDRETVGGDVDVAVISRSEGLVWVKRKHYFPAELNARFFARHFKSRS